MVRLLSITILFSFFAQYVSAQAVPSGDENIPFLINFGKNAKSSWGDDDNLMIMYFVVPKKHTKPFYIRVFDPNVGGKHDEIKGEENTSTKFTVYGGKGCVSSEQSRKENPEGDYKEGTLLSSKSFGTEDTYDDKWYTFGPFDPTTGEDMPEYGGYVFKIVAQGVSGDDGNLFRYYLSVERNANTNVEGGNAFTFEYSFRLHDDVNQTSHIYPFIENSVTSVKQANFDWDSDGKIRLVSKTKKGLVLTSSGDNHWSRSTYDIDEAEKNSSQDIQFIKDKNKKIANNNVVFNLTNQYGKYMPFYSAPIGGIPKYGYKIGVK